MTDSASTPTSTDDDAAADTPAAPAPLYLSESETRGLLSEELALEAAERAFIAAVRTAPAGSLVLRGSDPVNRFSVKPGASPDGASVKIGSFWPGNPDYGLARHHSTLLLLNQRIGRVGAIMELGVGNGYRTAAADALAADRLARDDARTLAVFGTGHQSVYEVQAVAKVRRLTRILVVGRSQERSNDLAAQLRSQGLPAESSTPEPACAAADIIITATTCKTEDQPLFDAAWVTPGTHISAMGADGPEKRELPTELLEQAQLFCDVPEQSRSLGEFKHAPESAEITALGEVLLGTSPGRRTPEAITVFDSSGFGLQDLYLGLAIMEKKGIAL